MKASAIIVAVLSFIYSWVYINASFFPTTLGLKSDYAKIVANIIFAALALSLALYARKNKTITKTDNEINFSIAFCPMVIALAEPLANLMKSENGLKFIIAHSLGITALGYSLLMGIILFAIIMIGIKMSE